MSFFSGCMYNSQTDSYNVYRLYSSQQAEDGWVSHNEFGIFSNVGLVQTELNRLIEEEADSMSEKDLKLRKVDRSNPTCIEVENGLYAWQTYYIKKYVLDEALENDMYTEDPPRTPKW